jgi:hypothetical protein
MNRSKRRTQVKVGYDLSDVRQGIIAKRHIISRVKKYNDERNKRYRTKKGTICQAVWMGHHCKCSKRKEMVWPIAHSVHGSYDKTVRGEEEAEKYAWLYNTGKNHTRPSSRHLEKRSPRKDLDHAVATAADDPATITAPDDGADALTAHQPVTGQFLCAAALLEVPEPQACVVAG